MRRESENEEVVIKTTQFYEGFTHEAEMGIMDAPQHELKLKPELESWCQKYGRRDGWRFLRVDQPYKHHWHAYDDAQAGKPVALRFWFGDPAIAALFKLTWHEI